MTFIFMCEHRNFESFKDRFQKEHGDLGFLWIEC